MNGCVNTGAGSAGTTSAAESKADTGEGRGVEGGGTSTTDTAAEAGSSGTWRYKWKQDWIVQVRRIDWQRWVLAATCSVTGWLVNWVVSENCVTGWPEASNTGTAPVPPSAGIWKYHKVVTAAYKCNNNWCPHLFLKFKSNYTLNSVNYWWMCKLLTCELLCLTAIVDTQRNFPRCLRPSRVLGAGLWHSNSVCSWDVWRDLCLWTGRLPNGNYTCCGFSDT